MTAEQESALFSVPEAYVVPLWALVPNEQDLCAVVDLDELDATRSDVG